MPKARFQVFLFGWHVGLPGRALRLLVIFVSFSCEVLAQTSPDDLSGDIKKDADEIVVQGQKLLGSDISPLAPDLILMESDIAAYGVSSIGELLTVISEETGSARRRPGSRPIVLVNGRRVSGFQEIGRYPVEALARVEVLSEQASLSYGFPPEQRVINFILKEDVTINAIDAGASSPQSGGSTEADMTFQRLFIDGDSRLSLDAAFKNRPDITESERFDIPSPLANSQRSIIGDLNGVTLGASWTQPVFGRALATVSYSFDSLTNKKVLDQKGVASEQDNTEQFFGLTVNSQMAPNTWSVTASYSNTDDKTAFSMSQPDSHLTDVSERVRRAKLDGVLSIRPLDLSAGPLTVTLNAGLHSQLQRSARSVGERTMSVASKRMQSELGVSINLPVMAFAKLPGDVIFDVNARVQDFSDVGFLGRYGAGFTWYMSDYFQLTGSQSREQGAPVFSDLTAPILITPTSRVFDPIQNEGQLVDIISGGNPELSRNNRLVRAIGLQWTPRGDDMLRLSMGYTELNSGGEVKNIEILTPEFERAFPDRILRDESGHLERIDLRPIATHQSHRKFLQSRISWSRPIKAVRKIATGNRPKKRLRSGRPGNLRLSLSHDYAIEDTVKLVDGGERLDLLSGDNLSRLGGARRHHLNFIAYRWNEGLGSLLAIRYTSGSNIKSNNELLSVSDRLLVEARLTYEFNYSDAVVTKWPWLEETRILIGVDNLFDDPILVSDAFGTSPEALQSEILDPFGRTFRVEIRKRF